MSYTATVQRLRSKYSGKVTAAKKKIKRRGTIEDVGLISAAEFGLDEVFVKKQDEVRKKVSALKKEIAKIVTQVAKSFEQECKAKLNDLARQYLELKKEGKLDEEEVEGSTVEEVVKNIRDELDSSIPATSIDFEEEVEEELGD